MLFSRGVRPKNGVSSLPASLKNVNGPCRMAVWKDAPKSPTADAEPQIAPYLGLRARLSQIWFNRWTVLLVLVLVRTLMSISSLVESLGSAKAQALAACTKVEGIGSAMASMPHYLSRGVNSLAADGITKTVSGMVQVLMMILQGVEAIIVFVIDMYAGTYMCLLSAFVHGGLDLVEQTISGATTLFNEGAGGVADGISSAVSGIQDAINAAYKIINDAENAAGNVGSAIESALSGIRLRDDNGLLLVERGIGDPPKLAGRLDPLLRDLRNMHIDSVKAVAGLDKLDKTIPDYNQAKNLTQQAIAVPFDMLKKKLNETYGGFQFNASIFPVAQKEALSFCSGNSALEDFFASLFKLLHACKTGFLVTLTIAAILACVPMAGLEIRRWRKQKQSIRVLVKHGYDLMDVVYITSRPFSAGAGINAASAFTSKKRQLLTRWTFAYATSLPAIFVLCLALAGFSSCFCQWVIMKLIEREVPALASKVGDFSREVVTTLEKVSTRWAHDANGVMLGLNKSVNDDVLGWVQTATGAVNKTLNDFEELFNKGISVLFEDTPLNKTVHDLVNCLILNKVDAVEKGLTWVHDHAHVNLPLFANDTFSQGASASIAGDIDMKSFLASPSSVTTDELTDAVDHVLRALRSRIIQEALISLGLLLVYVIVVLIGVVWALASLAMPDKNVSDAVDTKYLDAH